MSFLGAILEWLMGKPELDTAAEAVSIRAKEIAVHFQQPSLSWHILLAIFGEVQNGQIQLVSSWEQVQDARVQKFAAEMLRLFTAACQSPKNYWKDELPDEIEDLKDWAVRLADQDAIGKTPKVRVKHLFLACLKMPSVKAVLLSADLDLKTLGWAAPKIEEVFAEIRTSTIVDIPFCRDITTEALEGRLLPLIGRTKELARLVQILTRKSKNNAVLVGEAGVGKTAIVEGLAQRIITDEVPPLIRGARVLALDLGAMVAGTRYRGEHEERIRAVISGIKEAESQVFLFVDELHNLLGAAEGAMAASEIFKPALARGEINCIGATTLDEYRKYIEKDPALERRFQPIYVDQPSTKETLEILFGIRAHYENYHGVKISDEAIEVAVRLAGRYLPDRNLPDKAIDLIDEAASAVKNRVSTMRQKQPTETASVTVTEEDVASIVSMWTGVSVGKMTQDETKRLLGMEAFLHRRVIGQDEAIGEVSTAVRRSGAKLKDPRRPAGSFIFLGPTGVGKTELAKTLAEFLFDDESNMLRIDMSEFSARENLSRLIGAAPGLVGYDEGGQLTEPVRRRPYQLVLLDEIEKACREAWNFLLQVLEEGRLTDGSNRTVDFKNTVIIMTSNIGSEYINDPEMTFEAARSKVLALARKAFPAEFFNRIDAVVIFHRLEKKHLFQILDILLQRLQILLSERNITLELTDGAKDFLVTQGYDPVFGARPLKRTVTRYVENPLSEALLKGDFNDGDDIRGRLNKKEDGIEFILKDQG